MDKVQFKALLTNFVTVADMLAKLTPNAVDNQIVDSIKLILANEALINFAFFLYELISKKPQLAQAFQDSFHS